MEFYESIAEYYDRVFPYDPAQKDFTLSCAKNSKSPAPYRVLETGCGSGSLALALAAAGHTVDASDFDPGMVALALHKRGKAVNPGFRELDMRRITDAYPLWSFDAVICYGNTLVHLGGPAETGVFFQAARKVLKPGGRFCLQILNYDRILDQSVDHLPVILHGGVRFERFYAKRPDGKLDFRTVLTPPDGQEIENSIPLYPLRRAELETALRNAGFEHFAHFGGFDRSKFVHESMALVTEAW